MMPNSQIKKLEIVYIVPSRYDDDGYVQRWTYGVVPSHSLAVVSKLTEDMAARKPFGDEVEITIHRYDDNIQKIPFDKLAQFNQRSDTRVVVGFVGVQTNQFPRAVDLARKFRQAGIPVLIGGFHVTGVVNLFAEIPADLQKLLDEGISLVCGEAETSGVLESLFADFITPNLSPAGRILKTVENTSLGNPAAQRGGDMVEGEASSPTRLGRIYRFPFAPSIENAPLPTAQPSYIKHFGARWATIDSSRGCPYGCSFCTVINIQGRKMRCRSAETVLKTVRENYACGIINFFFTDDNFARSKHWREIFDGLIEMQQEGKKIGFMMQVDTQSYCIENFASLAKKAGCRSVFVGMESVNPQNIAASNKSQNSVEQYRPMVAHWQDLGVMVHVGYIVGFPHDTHASVVEDVRFLRDQVGVDLASFFMMTPLPGSVDHLEMVKRGDAIDPDWNKFDSFHETFAHPKMKSGEWKAAALAAYSEFYSKENIAAILRRTPRTHYWLVFQNLIWYRYSGVFSGTHPMMTGFFRKKYRNERRAGLSRESFFSFAWRRVCEFFSDAASYTQLFFEFQEIWFLTRRDEIAENQTAWIPLTEWAQNWTAIHQKVQQRLGVRLSGRYEEIASEMRTFLANISESLRQTSEQFAWKFSSQGNRDAESLEEVASEIDAYLETIKSSRADISLIERTQTFVQDRLAPRYEELAFRYVALRRRINQWRRDIFRNLREGHVVLSTCNLLTKPWFIAAEAYLSLRFSIAAMRKEI